MTRDDSGPRGTTWRALEAGPSAGPARTVPILYVLPFRVSPRSLVPSGLLRGRGIDEGIGTLASPEGSDANAIGVADDQGGQPLLGLDPGRIWRRAYCGRGVPEK